MSASTWWTVALVLALLALVGLYLSMTAGRLDRLHRRIETAGSALDVLLARRCALTVEIAGSGMLDPATATVLIDSAHTALAAADEEPNSTRRWLAESDLSRTLGGVFDDPDDVEDLLDDPGATELLGGLSGVCQRLELSRRFLNDGVRACRQVRRQRLVRWFRLAGHTPWPQMVEMDDTPPPGLSHLMP